MPTAEWSKADRELEEISSRYGYFKGRYVLLKFQSHTMSQYEVDELVDLKNNPEWNLEVVLVRPSKRISINPATNGWPTVRDSQEEILSQTWNRDEAQLMYFIDPDGIIRAIEHDVGGIAKTVMSQLVK